MTSCMQKEDEVCCADTNFRQTVCIPLLYCMIALGEHDFGPIPPCGTVKFGDASKCKQSAEEIQKEMEMAKSMCFGKVKELYDLQSQLGQCVAEVSDQKTKLDGEHKAIADVQQEAVECETKKTESQTKQQLGGLTGSEGGPGDICPAETAALAAASTKFGLALATCMSAQLSVAVPIPVIDLKIPEIKVGVVNAGGSFNIDVPDFAAPDFNGEIVVPGGGGKLNVPVGGGDSASGGEGAHKLTFDARMASIKADIAECEESKQKVVEKEKDLASTKDKVQAQKQQSCEEQSSFLQTRPEIEDAIQVLSTLKMAFGCAEVQVAIDEFIAVLHRC
eukprot:6482574-Amphidinium_carterae.1